MAKEFTVKLPDLIIHPLAGAEITITGPATIDFSGSEITGGEKYAGPIEYRILTPSKDGKSWVLSEPLPIEVKDNG